MTSPALGYRSRTDAVLALKAQGDTRAQIARKLKTTEKNVETLARYGRRRGSLTMDVVGSLLPSHARDQLVSHAVRRKMTVDALMLRIVSAVASDDMVDAVLDDRGAA